MKRKQKNNRTHKLSCGYSFAERVKSPQTTWSEGIFSVLLCIFLLSQVASCTMGTACTAAAATAFLLHPHCFCPFLHFSDIIKHQTKYQYCRDNSCKKGFLCHLLVPPSRCPAPYPIRKYHLGCRLDPGFIIAFYRFVINSFCTVGTPSSKLPSRPPFGFYPRKDGRKRKRYG